MNASNSLPDQGATVLSREEAVAIMVDTYGKSSLAEQVIDYSNENARLNRMMENHEACCRLSERLRVENEALKIKARDAYTQGFNEGQRGD